MLCELQCKNPGCSGVGFAPGRDHVDVKLGDRLRWVGSACRSQSRRQAAKFRLTAIHGFKPEPVVSDLPYINMQPHILHTYMRVCTYRHTSRLSWVFIQNGSSTDLIRGLIRCVSEKFSRTRLLLRKMCIRSNGLKNISVFTNNVWRLFFVPFKPHIIYLGVSSHTGFQ